MRTDLVRALACMVIASVIWTLSSEERIIDHTGLRRTIMLKIVEVISFSSIPKLLSTY